MSTPEFDQVAVVERVIAGDEEAWGELCTRLHPSLRRMVQLRLDPRLRPRLDASDVIHETYIEAHCRLEEFKQQSKFDFVVWLRMLLAEQLIAHHRRHLGAQRRDVRRELPLFSNGWLGSSSDSLAELIASQTSPSHRLIEAEQLDQLRAALDQLPPEDRELLVLRHFEQLTNEQAAQTLGLSPSTASYRYLRALDRLKDLLTPLNSTADP